MAWLNALALAGLGLMVVPIAIHLFVRQQVRTLAYPSLRFLRQTQLAAFRRRRVQDAALLGCRMAIIAAAAVALAGPVLQTAGRSASHANRVSRAIVVAGATPDDVRAMLAADAYATATFTRAHLADSLADALRWLEHQPPSAREVVIAGALRRGAVEATDLAVIPDPVGIRFVQTAAVAPAEIDWPVLSRRNGALVRIDRRVRLDADRTVVTDAPTAPTPNTTVSVVAAAADQTLADAALSVALDAGIPWRDFERPVVVVWSGAEEERVRGLSSSARVARMVRPASPSAAADDTTRALMRAAGPPAAAIEPIVIDPDQLERWSRRPGPPAVNAPPTDEGDRRWFWGLALVLLAFEWRLRRERQPHAGVIDGESQVRVA